MLFALNPLGNNDKSKVQDAMTATPLPPRNVLALAAVLVLAAGIGLAHADEKPPAGNPDADAARLVDEVMRKAGGNDGESLGAWTRDVVERALGRAGSAARQTVPGRSGETSPLPAERHAGELSGPRSGSAEVPVFTSLSVPAASWRQWAHEAARTGAPLVLRGVGEGGLPGTAKEIGARIGSGAGARIGSGAGARIGSGAGARLGGAEAGVAIDPRLFRLFGITRVPAVVVVPGGVPPCRSRGCAGDPAPPHDLVTGNIGLKAALEAVAEEGSVARKAARSHLQRLRGEDRP